MWKVARDRGCGKQRASVKIGETEKKQTKDQEPDVSSQSEQSTCELEEDKKSKTWLWILLVLLVAGGWYFYSNSGWSDDKVAQMETIDTDSIPMPVETEAEALPEQTEFRVSSITYDKSSKEINTQLSIDYPETDNIVLKENILKFIVESLTNDYTWGERPRPTYEGSIQDGNAILEFFANEKIKEISEEWERDSIEGARAWEEFISVKLIFQSTKTISYTVCFGGCHGGVADGKYYGVTFNRENGNIINVIKDPSDENLKRMLISQLETGDTEGLLFREEYMAHPFPQKSPYIYNDSVRFVYQKYEIAPGACGPVEVSIPVPEVIPYMSEEAISAVSE